MVYFPKKFRNRQRINQASLQKQNQPFVNEETPSIEEEVKFFNAPESRKERIANDTLEQRLEFQNTFFGILCVAIIILYCIFFITVICLFLSLEAFHKEFPITGVILVGMTGSIPTLLSVFIIIGVFTHKDSTKDKDEKSNDSSAVSTITKVCTELLKTIKHH
ncbi:hypothetical protein [Undibacterium sp. CY21W]|uniref:hypothetical protein n=1 Tax=Undibacterium sp. CY21W TaxID=2762293 RepID=UPI00164A818E|nr:hypothetical protein [Undibacterium sp. CY21W]MBC3927763.1 hypothetical protein [Undibacterium sp. CY21W]